MKVVPFLLLIMCYQALAESPSSYQIQNAINKLNPHLCATTDSWKAKEEFDKQYSYIINYITTNKDKIAQVGWGVDAEKAVSRIKKAHEYWLKLIKPDCELWAYSPLNAGSRNDDYEGCTCSHYVKRLAQLAEYERAWVGHHPD